MIKKKLKKFQLWNQRSKRELKFKKKLEKWMSDERRGAIFYFYTSIL